MTTFRRFSFSSFVQMFANFTALHSVCAFGPAAAPTTAPGEVVRLAAAVLGPTLAAVPGPVAALISATTCPDRLAPSLGQELAARFPAALGQVQLLDLVQGCAGGVSALLLASQLAGVYGRPVAVVLADAARRATAPTSPVHGIFGDGACALLMQPPAASGLGLVGSRSRQFPGLVEVVTIGLGHDADRLIAADSAPAHLPRRYLGLTLHPVRAARLLARAGAFYRSFVAEVGRPDVLILHQAGPLIITRLAELFAADGVEVISTVEQTGNCGAASVGLALAAVAPRLAGRRLMICGYGTGGVITAGLWQC